MAKLDAFFSKMVEIQGSDLHLTTGLAPYFRLHGDMIPVSGVPPIEAEEMRRMLYEITPDKNREQFESAGMTSARPKLVYTSRRGRRSKW